MSRLLFIFVSLYLIGCSEKTPESYVREDKQLILCKPLLSGEKDILFYAEDRTKYEVNNVPQIYNYIIKTVDGQTVSISSLEETNYKCEEVKKPSISQ